ncbi:MAG: SRPBCC family protein [Rhodothermales bacterium]|nr:SRPBCC family protein [Rhodothermales bacterium]
MKTDITIERKPDCWQLETSLLLEHDIETVFAFFSDPYNLEIITPPLLRFNVLGMDTQTIDEGSLISYKLRLRGIPVKWLTRIEMWDPPHQFVDRQLKGPYKLWHHTHTFESVDNGTLMRDIVRYRVPGGALINRLLVEKDVRGIFEYRRERIVEIFKDKV